VLQPPEFLLKDWAECAAWNAFKYDGWSPTTSICVRPEPTRESPEEQDIHSLTTEWVEGHAYRMEAAFCPIAPPSELQTLKDTCSKHNVNMCNELSEKWIGFLQAEALTQASQLESEEEADQYRQVIAMRIKVERARSRELMDIRLHQLRVIEMHAECFTQAELWDYSPPFQWTTHYEARNEICRPPSHPAASHAATSEADSTHPATSEADVSETTAATRGQLHPTQQRDPQREKERDPKRERERERAVTTAWRGLTI